MTYRERLTPSLWTLVAAAMLGPMVALTLGRFDSTVALVGGAVVGIAVVVLLIALSPVVEVREGELRAGRAHIPVEWLGEPVALTGPEARDARGPKLDPRAWMLLRGGIDGVLSVSNTDPDDPVPSWLISSRTPDRLAAAITAAQITRSRGR